MNKMNRTEARKITRLYGQLAVLKEMIKRTTGDCVGINIIHVSRTSIGNRKESCLDEVDITENEVIELLRSSALKTMNKLISMGCEIDGKDEITPEKSEKSEKIKIEEIFVLKKAVEEVIEKIEKKESGIARNIISATVGGDYHDIYDHLQDWAFCAGEKFAYRHVLGVMKKELT